MSGYDVTIIVFGVITIVISFVRLMIYIANMFSKRK
jgi:hypothetical protein